MRPRTCGPEAHPHAAACADCYQDHLATTDHEDLCPDNTICDEGDGWLCDLVTEVRLHTLRLALDTVDKGGRAATQLQALLDHHDKDTP